ncbi:thioredoxin family protein [[Phormidium] sp. ETS-05]|uniref:thioredoxin family protein n=1 Tax=[Phormidium] sp. ETS-05 TaxID=222819 RepID=UPI0018EEFD8A|nr:thioredoxin family protein [[Phormidium] sp. ETS-05]
MSAIKIEILGSGCKKCHQLEANARTAVSTLGIDAEVAHITDAMEIAKRGILSTPALAVNGKVVSKGKLISPAEIQQLLTP